MSIHDKINQLRRMTPENGATEAEAIAAINLAAKLMEKHGITEEELRASSAEKDMRTFTEKPGIKQMDAAFKICGVTIAQFCEVRCWWNEVDKTGNFFGFNGDVDMAEYLFDLISGSMRRSWKEFLARGEFDRRVGHHRRYWSFHFGFGERVNAKMRELILAREARRATGTSLVILKNELVTERMDKKLLASMRKTVRKTKINVDDYFSGALEGEKVNLQRPVGKAQGGAPLDDN